MSLIFRVQAVTRVSALFRSRAMLSLCNYATQRPVRMPAPKAGPRGSTPHPDTIQNQNQNRNETQNEFQNPKPKESQTAEPADTMTQSQSNVFVGMAQGPFPEEIRKELLKPVALEDVELKPDGMLYLPEIKYRRKLNAAFGPGGWALRPLGAVEKQGSTLTREYAMYALGQYVGQARGEQELFGGRMSEATAEESAKSNAMMRCCKDLGIASELWDPEFIQKYKSKFGVEVWCTHAKTKEKKRLWRKKDRPPMAYPWQEA